MRITSAMSALRNIAASKTLPDGVRRNAESAFEDEVRRAVRDDARRFYAEAPAGSSKPNVRTNAEVAEDETPTVDPEKAIKICRATLADEDATPKQKRWAREILAALGEDVDDAEDGARAVARCRSFMSPDDEARRANDAQHRAMTGRR